MKAMIKAAVGVALAWGFLYPVARANDMANQNSGNNMLPYCKSLYDTSSDMTLTPETMLTSGKCVGVIQGVISALTVVGIICPPKYYKVDQLVKMTVKYIEDHPEKSNSELSLLAMFTFTEAWRCNPKK